MNSEDLPIHVSRRVFPSPKPFHPIRPFSRNPPRHLIMSSLTIWVSPKEQEDVMQLGIGVRDGHVVHPGLDAVDEPLAVGGGFEDDGVGGADLTSKA